MRKGVGVFIQNIFIENYRHGRNRTIPSRPVPFFAYSVGVRFGNTDNRFTAYDEIPFGKRTEKGRRCYNGGAYFGAFYNRSRLSCVFYFPPIFIFPVCRQQVYDHFFNTLAVNYLYFALFRSARCVLGQ